MSTKTTRMSFEQIKKLKGLSDAKKVSSMTDKEIDQIIDSDPDLHHLTDEELSEFQLAKGKNDGK